ncbi:MAG: hypothetical protein V4631_15820 [Pseudomonadota bacterium]
MFHVGNVLPSDFTYGIHTMFTSRYSCAVLALSSLTACTSVIPYAPAATRPEARIRIVTPVAGHFAVQMFGLASGSCDGPMMDFGSTHNTPIGMIADPTRKAGWYIERKIPAGKPYILFARAGAIPKACGMPISFRPEPDADYEATISGYAAACQLVLTRLGTNPDGGVTAAPEASARSQPCPDLK